MDRQLRNIVALDRRPEVAIEEIISLYPNDPLAAYLLWAKTRSLLTADESNRNKYYKEKVINLIRSLPPDHPDIGNLYDLLEAPLRIQHRVYTDKRSKLVSLEVHKDLIQIRPMIAAFYNFELPVDITQAAMSTRRKKALQQVTVVDKKVQIEHSDMRTIMTFATDILESAETYSYHELVLALQIVSGRRLNEIIKTLEVVRDVPDHPYQAVVRGVSKINDLDQEFTIPLLCPWETFVVNLERSRTMTNKNGDLYCEASGSSSGNYHVRKRLFGGDTITHTMLRGLYATMAYQRRSENKYMEFAEQAVFKSHALGLNSDKFDTSTIFCYTKVDPHN